jgi:hypothetical protein
MNLFTDRFVDRSGVPASIFQSINPIYIILLAPLFAGIWITLGKRGSNRRRLPSSASRWCRWAWPIWCWSGARRRSVSR